MDTPSIARPLYEPELRLYFAERGTREHGEANEPVLRIKGPFHDFVLNEHARTITEHAETQYGTTLNAYSLNAPILHKELALLCNNASFQRQHALDRDAIDFLMRHDGQLGVSGRSKLTLGENIYLWDPDKHTLSVAHEDATHFRVYHLGPTGIIEPTLEDRYLLRLQEHVFDIAAHGARHGIEVAHHITMRDGHVDDYTYMRISKLLEPRTYDTLTSAHDVHTIATDLATCIGAFSAISPHDATRIALLAADHLVSAPTLIGLLASDAPYDPYLTILEVAQEHMRTVNARPRALDAFLEAYNETPGFFPAFGQLDTSQRQFLTHLIAQGEINVNAVRDIASTTAPERLLALIARADALRTTRRELEHDVEFAR